MSRGIAVVGKAWETPLGRDIESTWQRLLSGESGFVVFPENRRLRNAAFAPATAKGKPEQRFFELAESAIERACDSAGIRPTDRALRVILGTSLAHWTEEPAGDLPAATTERLRRSLGLAHDPIWVCSACSSGSDAVAIGTELVRSGNAPIVVCGGVDVVTLAKQLAHSSLSTLTPDRPRAFDRQRNGMLLGEGSACVVLSSAGKAQTRSEAEGYILGVGQSNDAAGTTVPDRTGEGVALAIERALANARLGPDDIAVIQAHGSGTILNDATEAAAIHRIFGPDPPPVFATKSALGHSLGATGAIELVSLLLALRDGSTPPNAGLRAPDPSLRLNLCQKRACRFPGSLGISLTLGFGGFNTCLVVGATRPSDGSAS